MGVVKNQKSKTKTKGDDVKKHKDVNGKPKDDVKVKKKKRVSCLQCFKSPDDGGLEGKYRVAAPELMQDTFMSDSEDEGGEVECPIQQQQQYRYMNSEAGTLHRARPLEDSVADGHLWPSNNDSKVATIDRQPLDIGFLVSFVVDARGGAMKAKRRGGVRIIVPPAAAPAPTRVTCRAATRRAPAAAPPPLMEGEALASRLLELQPQGAKFLFPVVIEVPIFTASCPEREIVVLRSDTGDTWQDHYLHNNDNPMIQEALSRERQQFGSSGECLGEAGERVARVVTCDFPHYLAVVSRVRQEVHAIGPDGGTVSSAHIAQVQAQFPPQALTKRIRVGLQAHGASPALCARVLPRHAAVSPVLTVEPRRRKFHRSITLTVPLPQNSAQGGGYDKSSSSNLRLLCSIMGGQARAVWEDVTGSTPLTLTDDCASFTTTVSARFWLMSCQNVSDATKLATELYREMLLVPFEVRIVVLGKRLDALEGRLLVLYITDRYAYDTLLQQEHYTEVAHSTAVRFLDGKEVYLEFSGNLVPVTKSASQPNFVFEAFKDNRVEFTVRVKHHEETPSGRIYFMNEPKVGKGEQSQTPACVLDVQLPERIAPRAAKSHLDCLNLDQSGFDALKDELSFHWGDHNISGPGSLPRQHDKPQINGHAKNIANGDVKYTEKDKDDKDTKPQVNGDSVHVDSNKTKATFDSDEDKTPMNTLEKGKKKPEGGSFLGGLADRVKNVFSYGDDKEEDVKESSPKPQPKPRDTKDKTPPDTKDKSPPPTKEKSPPGIKEKSPSPAKDKSPSPTKDKSPPKPAPRLINEDLLGKVEDMFKDLHSKPHIKEDDDINSQVYSTKLIVDEEDKPHNLHKITEEVYHQYEHMQPVDTPLHCKSTDPFQFYDGCCEGRYKKGEKHRHDETSNVTDRIEHVKFAAHEQLQDLNERAENEAKDALEKVEKEKDNIKQKSNEVVEELIEKSERVVKDLKDREEGLRSDVGTKIQGVEDSVNNKVGDLKKSAQKAHDDVNAAAADLKTQVNDKISDVKSSAKDTVDNLVHTAEGAKDSAANKMHEFDFIAREKAEELKLRGQDKFSEFEGALGSATDSLQHKAHDAKSGIKDGANAVVASLHNVKDDLSNKAHDVKTNVQDKVDSAKDATNEKLHSIHDDLSKKSQDIKDGAKDTLHNVQDGINNKAHDVKTGIEKNVENVKEATNEKMHEINESLEDVKGKTKKKAKEGKNFFTGLVHNIFGEKDKIEHEVKDKVAETKESANDLLQQASATKDDIEKTVETKHGELKHGAEQFVQSVHDKKDEVVDAVSHKKDEIESTVAKKADEARQSLEDTKHGIEKSVQSKKEEVIKAKDAVQSAAETELDRIRQEAEHTTDEIKRTAEEKLNAAADKKAEIESGIANKFDDIKESGKDKIHEVQSAMTDKANDLQRSSKQAFDHAQDTTLSAFDKLESSAKDKVSDAQSTWEELQSTARDTYADMKDDAHGLESSAQDTLHSFQSSAGNTFDSLDDSVKEFGSHGVETSKELFGDVKDAFEGFQLSAGNKLEDVKLSSKQRLDDAGERLGEAGERLGEVGESVAESVKESEAAVADKLTSEADKFTSNLNDLGNSVFGSSGKGFMKDSSTKLLESEKAQSSPHKKSSGIPKLKRKK